VSSALAELARSGQLMRRDDGTWLLTGEPPLEHDDADDPIRQRRRLMPGPDELPGSPEREPVAVAVESEHVPDSRLVQLRASMAAAREESAAHRRQLEELQAALEVIRGHTLERRRERAAHLERLRAAAARRAP
jgi:hypothetical protein